MAERYIKPSEKIERLELEQLKNGDIITITTGTDDDVWKLPF